MGFPALLGEEGSFRLTFDAEFTTKGDTHGLDESLLPRRGRLPRRGKRGWLHAAPTHSSSTRFLNKLHYRLVLNPLPASGQTKAV